jgi:hypothetical protein
VPIESLPHEVLPDLMPTRYCESDRLASAAWKMFGDAEPGYARVKAVSDWIRDHVEYRTGSTNTATTACDVFLQRAGVCRDFAHLGVTFLPCLEHSGAPGIGYARFDKPPPDFHAVFEAFLGERWELFDATGLTDPHDMVRIAVGRDAGDVAFAICTHAADPAGGRAGARAAGSWLVPDTCGATCCWLRWRAGSVRTSRARATPATRPGLPPG